MTALGAVGALVWAAAVLVVAVRYRTATGERRGRLQWLAAGALVVTVLAIAGAALHVLVDWPPDLLDVMVPAVGVVPASVLLGRPRRLVFLAERALVPLVVLVGIVGLVAGAYVAVVVGLGRVPDRAERGVLALSMLAAAIGVGAVLAVRHRLEHRANQWVYGDRRSPEETLRTFGGRMSRAVPMDELLLQLVESLRATLRLRAAELWTGADGDLTRSVSLPDVGQASLHLRPEEVSVVARAHAQGNAWMRVWIPSLVDGREDHVLRSVSIAHLGRLFGLLVLERGPDDPPFTESEDAVLVDLARQVGLALHNVRLDNALQASLDELQLRNRQLVASRARVVAAADESRRRIERDLHDGAQQHLVALAVKVGLVRTLLESDPDTARTMLDELKDDVRATLTELRELAHGIYPPLLRDRGLAEALGTAANRSTLRTVVEADGLGRYESGVETAVYFCCLEAMQNSGKYAGPDATVTVRLAATDGTLTFEVADDGPGFDTAVVEDGHGFVNMRDRLGAVGGDLDVVAAPGAGTAVRGTVPVPAVPEPEDASVAP